MSFKLLIEFSPDDRRPERNQQQITPSDYQVPAPIYREVREAEAEVIPLIASDAGSMVTAPRRVLSRQMRRQWGDPVMVVAVVAMGALILHPGLNKWMDSLPPVKVVQSAVKAVNFFRPKPAATPSQKPQKPQAAKPPTSGLFSGEKATRVGTPIAAVDGRKGCRITDIRRWRARHPVTGAARYHNGIDIGCGGTHRVFSPVAGKLTILVPSKSGGGGLVARIATPDGWTIQNMHMMSISLKSGSTIKPGQEIGVGGAPNGHPNAGTSTGPHSHYERWRTKDGAREYVTPTLNELRALLGAPTSSSAWKIDPYK
jgi:murein DD-endopeptidase MepM/ murein hydrolase activator NlpD